MITAIPPAWILILGGSLALFLHPGAQRNLFLLFLSLAALAAIWVIPARTLDEIAFAGLSFKFTKLHPYTQIFATAFALTNCAGCVFSAPAKQRIEAPLACICAGAAIGITYSGTLISLFLYMYIIIAASTVIILCGKTAYSLQQAQRYALMHITSSTLFLAGIATHSIFTGSTELPGFMLGKVFFTSAELQQIEHLPALFMLLSLLISCAMPPFSLWLTGSIPATSPFGALPLSAYTTYSALFMLLMLFPASDILVPIGLIMTFYGIIGAIMQKDIRRMLAYTIIHQLGFMLVAIGIGTPLALKGVALMAFSQLLATGLLFMTAGSVISMTGKQNFAELGGLYRSMKLTAACAITGIVSMTALPFTSSKLMILEATSSEQLHSEWLLLICASAISVVFLLYPWRIFFAKDSGLRPKEPPHAMQLAMLLLAVTSLLLGFMPKL
jgi:multicomponent Na+:H+ antiporter subunit D